MSDTDWAKLYARMDDRLRLKYQQLPDGEQAGKRAQAQATIRQEGRRRRRRQIMNQKRKRAASVPCAARTARSRASRECSG